MKKERATMSDEQRERQHIAEQIERAAAEQGGSEPQSEPEEAKELKRDEGAEKVVLSLSMAKPKPSLEVKAATSTGIKLNPLKANPLKRPNVFKAPATKKSTDSSLNDKKRSLTATEALILEEQERKRRKLDSAA
jgi:DNA/RNA-binding protein KIN17